MPGYTREDLKRLQAMSLDDKIQHSISMIEIFYMREHGGCYYSFSGGKDSTVLKSLMEIDYNGSLVKDVPLGILGHWPRIPGNSQVCHVARERDGHSPETEFCRGLAKIRLPYHKQNRIERNRERANDAERLAGPPHTRRVHVARRQPLAIRSIEVGAADGLADKN